MIYVRLENSSWGIFILSLFSKYIVSLRLVDILINDPLLWLDQSIIIC